ncbi:MAG: oligosaccharide flippase family protein [Proteobacteria bacterium]|nr:oligosaccharide flippase family protein [Pseudomonadota bacterium]
MTVATATRELRALSWTAVSTVGGTLITVGRAALLARLLSPDDFGLFGLVFFALSALSTLTDLGFARLIIVAKFEDAGQERRFLDTAWTAHLLRSIILAVLVVCFAVPYATSVHEPRLIPLLVVSSAWLIVAALASPGSLLLYRQLEQRALALARLGSDLVGLLITAALAWSLPSPWVLVIGFLCGAALTTLASYVIHPYRPRFAWDGASFQRGFAQSRYIAIVTAMTFVTTQVDNYLVGRILGPAALGLYLFAYRLAALPVEMLQTVVNSVAMPAFARHRDDGASVLADQLRRVLVPTTALLCAGLLPAVLLRDELVSLLGGDHWTAAGPLLVPLFLIAVLRCTAIQMGTLLQSVGRAQLDALGKSVEAALFIPACAWSVTIWGLPGACWTGVAVYFLAVVLRTASVSVVLPGRQWAVTLDWARSALPAGIFALAGSIAEARGASHMWVAAVALALYLLTVVLQPHLLERVAALVARRAWTTAS